MGHPVTTDLPETVIPPSFVPLLGRPSEEAQLVRVLAEVLLDARSIELLPLPFRAEFGSEVAQGGLGGVEGALGVGEGDGRGGEGGAGGGGLCVLEGKKEMVMEEEAGRRSNCGGEKGTEEREVDT